METRSKNKQTEIESAGKIQLKCKEDRKREHKQSPQGPPKVISQTKHVKMKTDDHGGDSDSKYVRKVRMPAGNTETRSQTVTPTKTGVAENRTITPGSSVDVQNVSKPRTRSHTPGRTSDVFPNERNMNSKVTNATQQSRITTRSTSLSPNASCVRRQKRREHKQQATMTGGIAGSDSSGLCGPAFHLLRWPLRNTRAKGSTGKTPVLPSLANKALMTQNEKPGKGKEKHSFQPPGDNFDIDHTCAGKSSGNSVSETEEGASTFTQTFIGYKDSTGCDDIQRESQTGSILEDLTCIQIKPEEKVEIVEMSLGLKSPLVDNPIPDKIPEHNGRLCINTELIKLQSNGNILVPSTDFKLETSTTVNSARAVSSGSQRSLTETDSENGEQNPQLSPQTTTPALGHHRDISVVPEEQTREQKVNSIFANVHLADTDKTKCRVMDCVGREHCTVGDKEVTPSPSRHRESLEESHAREPPRLNCIHPEEGYIEYTVDEATGGSDTGNSSFSPNQKGIFDDLETSDSHCCISQTTVEDSTEEYHGAADTESVLNNTERSCHNSDVLQYCEMVIRNSISIIKHLARVSEARHSSGDTEDGSLRSQTIVNNDGTFDICDKPPSMIDEDTHGAARGLFAGILYHAGTEKPGLSPWWYINLGDDGVNTNSRQTTAGNSKVPDCQWQFIDWLNDSQSTPNKQILTDKETGNPDVSDPETNIHTGGGFSDLNDITLENSTYVSFDLFSDIENDLGFPPTYENFDDLFEEWSIELDDMLMGNRKSDWRSDNFRIQEAVGPSDVPDVLLPVGTQTRTPRDVSLGMQVPSGINGYRSTLHNTKHVDLSDGESSTLSCSGDDKFCNDDSDLDSDPSLNISYSPFGLGEVRVNEDDTFGHACSGKRLSPLLRSLGRSCLCESDDSGEYPEFYTDVGVDMSDSSRETPSSSLPREMTQQWSISRMLNLDDVFLVQDEPEVLSPSDSNCVMDNSISLPHMHRNGETRRRDISGYDADEELDSPSNSRKCTICLNSPSGRSQQTPSPYRSPRVRRTLYPPDTHCSSRGRRRSPRLNARVPGKNSDRGYTEAEDLAELSVENTVDFFLKMASPLKSQEEEKDGD